MPSFEPVRFAIIGGGLMSENHVRALRAQPETALVAIADVARDRGGRRGRAAELAERMAIPRYYDDHRRLLDDPEVDAVIVVLPNALHAPVTLAALEADKHVVVEKPLCLSLDDADRIVALAQAKRRVVGYAEELPFCPKFVRAKELVKAGVVGELFFLKQTEAHAGPYSEWFFDPEQAGGGALMDMGCHSIEYARFIFDKRPVRKVTAQMATYLHQDKRTPRGLLEDHVLVHLELEGGSTALLESGWTLQGGMESVSRHQGTRGVLDVDLLRGNGLSLFSLDGLAKEGLIPGWTVPEHNWLWENGYPQELLEFARAIREAREPSESAADGRAVLEIMWAAYASAASGRTIELPFRPDPRWRYPAEPWVRRAD